MAPRSGFTLTELLICIAIIAILAAILFPVLGRARNSAGATDDISKMHQLGLAYAIYGEQFGEPDGQPWRLVSTGLVPAALLASRLDSTPTGLAQVATATIDGSTKTPYKRTFIGYGDLVMKSWLWHEQCDGHEAQGWLIDPTAFEKSPVTGKIIFKGSYHRLLMDASVQVRRIEPTMTVSSSGYQTVSWSYHDAYCDAK